MASALTGLPDRFDPRRIFLISALGAAAAALVLLPPTGLSILALRFYLALSQLDGDWIDGRSLIGKTSRRSRRVGHTVPTCRSASASANPA